jgi:hypothetical protein
MEIDVEVMNAAALHPRTRTFFVSCFVVCRRLMVFDCRFSRSLSECQTRLLFGANMAEALIES